MAKQEIPVLLLTGYLGSGKTTLLNHILTNERGIRFAVIVNDIGEVNIDASLIQKGGIVGGKDSGDLVALQNGCICCTLKMDLVKQLADITAMGKFDYIVIEASGICEPAPIAQTICSIPTMGTEYTRGGVPRLDCIVTVVDALRLASEFGCGDKLRGDVGEEDIESLVVQQIEFCNVVLLNKISEVTPEQAAHIRTIVRALQPKAKIIECDYANVDLDEIIGTGMFDFEDVATSATWVREIERPVTEEEEHEAHGNHHHHHDHGEDDHDHDGHDHNEHEHGHHHHHHDHEHHHHGHDGEGDTGEYGIQTFVYYRRRPFDLNKFDYLASKWPENIIRTKGVVYFSANTDMSYLFEQAGVQKNITESGLWLATAPAEDLEQMAAADPTILRDWDPEIGDRMIKLVIIGQNLDREAISTSLDACLA